MGTIVKDFLSQLHNVPLWGIYVFLFVSGILQVVFAPYPGATILVFCGYLGSRGFYGGNAPIFLSFWTATLITSYIVYELGAWKGEEILKIRLIDKHFTPERYEKASIWVTKYGILVFFAAKFIPGMNLPVILLSGIFRVKRQVAYFGIFLISLIHDMLFYMIGSVVGNNWESIYKFMSVYNKTVICTLAVMAVVLFIIRFNCLLKRKTY